MGCGAGGGSGTCLSAGSGVWESALRQPLQSIRYTLPSDPSARFVLLQESLTTLPAKK